MQRINPDAATWPLCVDLDGTLVRTDTFIEAVLQLIRRNPLVVFLIPVWFATGFGALETRSRAAADPRRCIIAL